MKISIDRKLLFELYRFIEYFISKRSNNCDIEPELYEDECIIKCFALDEPCLTTAYIKLNIDEDGRITITYNFEYEEILCEYEVGCGEEEYIVIEEGMCEGLTPSFDEAVEELSKLRLRIG